MVKTVTAPPDPITEAAAHLAALRTEEAALSEREVRANMRLDALAHALPEAQAAADLALALADGDSGAADVAVRKLELERSNNESVLRGITIRRPQLAWELHVAEAALGRARAKAAIPDQDAAAITDEAADEFFGHLGEFIQAIKTAIAALPRDDQRGANEAYDEAQLARWLQVKIAEAGLNLDLAKHVQRGVGIGPTDTRANFAAILETLR